MTDSRYTPPVAPVHDIPPPIRDITRPREVVLAIQLAVANYLFGVAVIVLTWSYYSRFQSTGALITNQVFSVAISLWLYAKIYAGRNWARITLLALSVFGAAFTGFFSLNRTFVNIIAGAPLISKVQMAVGLVFTLMILWLLFVSPGREWFKNRSDP